MAGVPTGKIDRILVGAPATIALRPETQEGEDYSLSEPATFALYDGAGTPVEGASGDATVVDAHTLTATVPALEKFDTYTVHWTGVAFAFDSTLEVVGGHVFSAAAFRALRPSEREFGGYAFARIAEVRRQVEERAEDIAGVAFVPRGAREIHRGDGSKALILGHVELRELYALEVDGAPLTAEQIAALDLSQAYSGIVERAAGWPEGAVLTVHYAHGYDRPPASVYPLLLRLAGEYAPTTLPTKPSRAVAQSIDGQMYRLTIAGRDGSTGIPDVDAVLEHPPVCRKTPAVG